MANEIALTASLASLIAEYESKRDNIEVSVSTFKESVDRVHYASSIGGVYGDRIARIEVPTTDSMHHALLVSAWRYLYTKLNLNLLLTVSERDKFERSMANPAELTLDNIRATFGEHVSKPRQAILKGLSEVFCDLDNSYKSHSKVRIGVKGLPKRVIFTGYTDYIDCRMKGRIIACINALRLVQGRGPVDDNWLMDAIKSKDVVDGLSFKTFANGNVHMIFDAHTCQDINRALAEYYGDVLPDVEGEKGGEYRSKSTEVAKDLQFYPTPPSVAATLANMANRLVMKPRVLEPSCGEGALIDAFKMHVKNADIIGYEVDANRAQVCRDKGHRVITANFLAVSPSPEFDVVIMNPPFYGQHYLKHIEHAIRFLKPGGRLYSILPASAWYDHGKLPKQAGVHHSEWRDLPIGSFSSSGTNINTGIWSYVKHSC